MKRPRGRPSKNPEETTSNSIHVRVTSAQRLQLRRIAEEDGISIAGLIREQITLCTRNRPLRPRHGDDEN